MLSGKTKSSAIYDIFLLEMWTYLWLSLWGPLEASLWQLFWLLSLITMILLFPIWIIIVWLLIDILRFLTFQKTCWVLYSPHEDLRNVWNIMPHVFATNDVVDGGNDRWCWCACNNLFSGVASELKPIDFIESLWRNSRRSFAVLQ